jgi:hypothetical protein
MPPETEILLRQNAINWALGSIDYILHGERLQQSFILVILCATVHSCIFGLKYRTILMQRTAMLAFIIYINTVYRRSSAGKGMGEDLLETI